MKSLLALVASLAFLTSGFAQTGDPLPLWPDGAPDALGTKDTDIPTLTPYIVDRTSPTAADVVCPGGGYGGLANHEGHDYALWLNQQGVSALVLKYRLGSKGYRHPSMLNDAQRAIRLVRARARKWNIDPARVGIMGSSAGGHLASTAVTHFDGGNTGAKDPIDRQSCRPDFGILCYAVISMGEHTHKGARRNLLGENPDGHLSE
jgi:acetyl esterase/lipase